MEVPKTPEAAALSLRFANNLIELRRRAGLSQIAAAERAGLFGTHEIAVLERGLRVADLVTIVKVAGAVEAEFSELLIGMVWQLDPKEERVR